MQTFFQWLEILSSPNAPKELGVLKQSTQEAIRQIMVWRTTVQDRYLRTNINELIEVMKECEEYARVFEFSGKAPYGFTPRNILTKLLNLIYKNEQLSGLIKQNNNLWNLLWEIKDNLETIIKSQESTYNSGIPPRV